MTQTELQEIFQKYLDAFAATSPVEQERLLRSSVAEDVVYTNPGVEGRGLRNLLQHISVFQERFPGQHFRVNGFGNNMDNCCRNGPRWAKTEKTSLQHTAMAV